MKHFSQHGVGRRSLLAVAAGTLPFATVAVPAFAQGIAAGAWPERSVNLVVCFPPGGSTDLSARLLAPGLAEVLGKPVVIENRGGAGGNIGIGMVARAAPDGYTFLIASSVFVVNASLYRNPPYDPFRDFAYVATIGAAPNVVAVRSQLGINSFAELVTAVNADPDKFNAGVPGIGTTPHLAAEVLKLRTGMGYQIIPFAGAGPAVQAILAGTTQMLIASQGGAVEIAYRSGQIKVLAQTGATRGPDMQDIPTLAELGVSDAVSETFNALYAPVATPAPIVARMAEATLQVLRRPDVAARYRQGGVPVLAEGPDGLRARVAREVPIWRKVIQDAKISVE